MRHGLLLCVFALLTVLESGLHAGDPPRPRRFCFKATLDLVDSTSDKNRMQTRGAQVQTLVGQEGMIETRNASHILCVKVTPLESEDGAIRLLIVAQIANTSAPEYSLSEDPRAIIWQAASTRDIGVGETIRLNLGGVPYRYHGMCEITAVDPEAVED